MPVARLRGVRFEMSEALGYGLAPINEDRGAAYQLIAEVAGWLGLDSDAYFNALESEREQIFLRGR